MGSTDVSIKDVARHARVSLGTVSNVLNRPEKVSLETRDRVHASISELGFVRNESARQLRAGHSRTVGFLVLDVSNPFFTDVARGAERAAGESGSVLLIANSGEHGERELSYLDLFEEQRARGVLISPGGDVSERLVRLRSHGIPTVLVDSPAPDKTFSSVRTDDVAGGHLAIAHLIALGRTRLGFVGGSLDLHQVRDRLAGARIGIEESGLSQASLREWETNAPTVEDGRAVGRHIAALPASERPDAIFAANDLLAIGLMQALLLERSLTIPGDIALIGYDDIGWAESTVVPLSSVRQQSGLIGERAMRLLVAEAMNPDGFEHQELKFAPELIVRQSTSG